MNDLPAEYLLALICALILVRLIRAINAINGDEYENLPWEYRMLILRFLRHHSRSRPLKQT